MTPKALILASIIVGVSTISGQAHHAFARFDPDREVTLEGTVKEFQWTSPHAWIMLTVDRKGRPEEWAIEMNGDRAAWRGRVGSQGRSPPGWPLPRPSIRYAMGRMAANF